MNKEISIDDRDFKGVWIPKEIYLCEDLNWTEIILLTEIDSLDKGNGCFASNEYLAKFIRVKMTRLANIISSLRKRKYIEDLGFDGRKRYLRVIKKDNAALSKKITQHYQKSEDINIDINTSIKPPLYSLQSGGIVSENSGTENSGEKTLKDKIIEFKQIPEREKRIEIIQKDVQLRNFYVEKIYKFYVSRILPGARLTKLSKEKILTRMKEYSPQELAEAIQNFSEDTWWMENNAYRGLKWFFHNEDRIEQFLKLPEMKNYLQKNER